MFLLNKIEIQSKYLNCKYADPQISEFFEKFKIIKVHLFLGKGVFLGLENETDPK